MKSVAISRSFSNILSRDLSVTKRPLLMLNQNSNRIKQQNKGWKEWKEYTILWKYPWMFYLSKLFSIEPFLSGLDAKI